ncbi:unnamed protein product [Acanthoscelides obtectus]|uniref:Uncharacterized protein n=1 Tax=Acanthoscelides obtectus TaxID=200917 RepID=A0A9P0PX41_ACAOB|nr:unnamed protein product [Acanthoscelides obtectus]CAK1668569.1 hypothetical protein AOBTE_LOCUS26491 [Acanthoscelides obtectus]
MSYNLVHHNNTAPSLYLCH